LPLGVIGLKTAEKRRRETTSRGQAPSPGRTYPKPPSRQSVIMGVSRNLHRACTCFCCCCCCCCYSAAVVGRGELAQARARAQEGPAGRAKGCEGTAVWRNERRWTRMHAAHSRHMRARCCTRQQQTCSVPATALRAAPARSLLCGGGASPANTTSTRFAGLSCCLLHSYDINSRSAGCPSMHAHRLAVSMRTLPRLSRCLRGIKPETASRELPLTSSLPVPFPIAAWT
jgi:hypothetical protein